jgi:putative ABC transport system substrate-binding protein
MRELGHAEGVDYSLEVRYADGQYDSVPAQMDELVRLKPDIIVAGTMAGALAAKKLTNTVPIVSESMVDPIGFGVAAGQARPGGNVTGIMLTVEDLPTKLLELALETVPGANRVGLLVNPTNPFHPGFRRSLEVAARTHGVELVASEASTPDDLYAALQRLAHGRVKIGLILQDSMFLNERKRIALFAMAERLPTILGFCEGVEDGALMSYGVNLRESWRRAASFVDKILKGAKPADLPIEFPIKLELLINLITAKALELTIPPTLLARADEVIE